MHIYPPGTGFQEILLPISFLSNLIFPMGKLLLMFKKKINAGFFETMACHRYSAPNIYSNLVITVGSVFILWKPFDLCWNVIIYLMKYTHNKDIIYVIFKHNGF